MKANKKSIIGGYKTITCRKCGHKIPLRINLKRKIKWQTVRWAIGLGLLFEVIANIVVFLIFNGL